MPLMPAACARSTTGSGSRPKTGASRPFTSPAEIRTLARELGRTVVAVHRRRMELRQRGVRVTRLRRAH